MTWIILHPKYAERMANSSDPEQSNLGLPFFFCPNPKGLYGKHVPNGIVCNSIKGVLVGSK